MVQIVILEMGFLFSAKMKIFLQKTDSSFPKIVLTQAEFLKGKLKIFPFPWALERSSLVEAKLNGDHC